jgi:hypothetical protein
VVEHTENLIIYNRRCIFFGSKVSTYSVVVVVLVVVVVVVVKDKYASITLLY